MFLSRVNLLLKYGKFVWLKDNASQPDKPEEVRDAIFFTHGEVILTLCSWDNFLKGTPFRGGDYSSIIVGL